MRTNDTNPMRFLGHSTTTLDEIKQYVPAVFTTEPHPKVSDRYSFVSTAQLLESFEKLGWFPHSSRQSGKSIYSRHVVRLNNPSLGFLDLKSDKVKPQVIVDNSHNATSPAMAHMGLFRLVCSNGLVVAMPGMYSSIKLRHIGIDFNELKQLMEIIANQYVQIGKHIGDMQQYTLNQDQKEQFVMKAIAYREPHMFIKEDGTINYTQVKASVNPVTILDPIRGEDKANDLWTVFNLLQERLVKGQFERTSLTGRKSNPRGITNVARNIEFNKVIWSIANEFLGKPEDAVIVETRVYTSAKGKEMNVEVLEKLDNNMVQVKTEGGLTFAVKAEQLK